MVGTDHAGEAPDKKIGNVGPKFLKGRDQYWISKQIITYILKYKKTNFYKTQKKYCMYFLYLQLFNWTKLALHGK